jgi:tRNA 2-selenouridine synthase SelU
VIEARKVKLVSRTKSPKTMWANIIKNNVNMETAEKYQIVKAAKTRQNAASKLAIDNWTHILEIIKNDVEEKTDEVAASAKFEELDNRKRNADDNIPQHLHRHHQFQEQPRQVQEDCRGGVHGESRN